MLGFDKKQTINNIVNVEIQNNVVFSFFFLSFWCYVCI